MRNVHKTDVKVINLPTEQLDEDRGYKSCGKPYLTFGNPEDGSISWQNDVFSVAFIADTVEVILTKDGVEIPASGIPLSFPKQPDAVGFMIVWQNVLTGYGAGCYKVKANYFLQGFEFTLHYGSFDLMPYSVGASESTIRVLGQYDDMVKSYGINFAESGFTRSFRVKGNLHNEQPNTEHGNILKGDDKFAKYRNHGQISYDLETAPLTACELDPLFEIVIASNRLYLSDFNSANFRQYRDVEVVLRDEDEITYGEQFGHERQFLAPFKQKHWLVESKYSEATGDGQIFTSGLDFGALVCPIPTCDDGTVNVNQSDGNLISAVTVASGAVEPYNVADSIITINTNEVTENVQATDGKNFNLLDADGNAIAVDSVSGDDVTLDVSGGTCPIGATLMKTGQTTSYRTGDDGDIQSGRATDFFTLNGNNPFGNTNRFTDELGTQTYANDIVIDWSTYNGTNVLGYSRNRVNNKDWNESIDECLLFSAGTFTTGWRLPNYRELNNLIYLEAGAQFLDFTPFNIPAGFFRTWTSTTYNLNTAQRYAIGNSSRYFPENPTTTGPSYGYIPCRTFTVTGTTLT